MFPRALIRREAKHAGFQRWKVHDLDQSGIAVFGSEKEDRERDVLQVRADITSWAHDRRYDVWHDRAVVYFLTDAA